MPCTNEKNVLRLFINILIDNEEQISNGLFHKYYNFIKDEYFNSEDKTTFIVLANYYIKLVKVEDKTTSRTYYNPRFTNEWHSPLYTLTSPLKNNQISKLKRMLTNI